MVLAPILILLVFSYAPDYGWWVAPLGTCLALFTAQRAFRAQWKPSTGLQINTRQIAAAFIAFAILFPLFRFYVALRSQEVGISFVSLWQQGFPQYYLHTCAQVLNEEVALGGIPLLWLQKKISPRKMLLVAVGIAVMFAALHVVLYAWSPLVPRSTVSLSLLSFIALACVGVIRNALILKFGHIGFSLALHLAWNLTFFGGEFYLGNKAIEETERFNVFLGYPAFSAVLFLAAVFAVHSLSTSVVGRRETGSAS